MSTPQEDHFVGPRPRHNVALNGLSNVTVLRAPSEDGAKVDLFMSRCLDEYDEVTYIYIYII